MKSIKTFANDFKEFLLGSTFIDVAIGLLIAGAVKDLANSFTSAFVTPIITKLLMIAGVDTTADTTMIFGVEFGIQSFITAVVTFIIIMLVAFTILRTYAGFKEKFKKDGGEEIITSQEAELLIEIRDLLKEQNTNKES